MTPEVATRASQRRWSLPEGAVELVLVRHGSAARTGSIDPEYGHADPELTSVGREQAERVRERLRGERLDAVYSSPLLRARQTAAPLADELDLACHPVGGLREVFLGSWEGDFEDRVASNDPVAMRILTEHRWELAPGSESHEAFAGRVRDAVLEIAAAAQGGTGRVAVFTHAGVIAEICRQATECRPFAFLHAENASLTRLVVLGSGTWRVRTFNDGGHL